MDWLPDYNTVEGRLVRLFIFFVGPLFAVFWLPAVQLLPPNATPAWREYYAGASGDFRWHNSWELESLNLIESYDYYTRIDWEALVATILLSSGIAGGIAGVSYFIMKPTLNNYVKMQCDGSCGSGCPSHIACSNPDCTCTNHAVFGIARASALPPERTADSDPGQETGR